MAGKIDGPRPGWETLPIERQIFLQAQRERWFSLRAEAKKIAKLEAFLEVNKAAAANFFETKIAFINALADTVRDPESGEIDVDLVRQMDPKQMKILLDAIDKVEASAGFKNKTTTHKHEHSLTLADKFKQQQAIESGEDVHDVEVLGEE